MVYESDFYTVRRPYTRPTITSYSVTAIRPCMSIRGVIAPPGTHSKVRMSVLLGELNRIQHRHRPHLAIVPTEDFLCSRPLVDFDDEAKHIRAAADKLIRYVHTSVPHESRLPIRIVTAYDRYGPEGRYVSKYSPDIPTNIQCLSYYKEPSRVTIGRGHLACVSYAGGRGYPRRKHLYGDEIRDIGDEIKFRSYYARNVHPSRNDDALLLPTGFASRILLPDRRLLGTDEGRALVFQSKLIKPVSSGLSIKKEKPEKNTEKAPKPKSRTQVIEEQILAEEGAKTAGAKAPANVPVEVVEIEKPREEIPKEEEPAPIINRQLSTPAASEPEPEPIKEVTPPPVEPKQKSRKVDSKKKSSIKTPPVELEQLVEAVPVEEPEAAEEPIIVQEPTIEEKPAASDLEVQPVTATESITTEIVNPEPVKEEPKSEPEEQPVELSTTEPEASDPEPSQPVEEAPLPPPVESQEPEAQEPAQEAAPAVDADAPPTEAEPQKEEVVAADAAPSEEIPAEQTASEGENKVASDEVSNPTEPESVPTAESSDVLPPSTPCEPEPTPEVADSPAPAEAAIEEASEEPQPAEDPQSRLGAAPEAEADPSSNTTAGVEEEPQDEIAGQPAEPQPQNPTDEPIISEVEGTPSSEVPPETTEPIVEEPPSPVTEQ